MFEWSTCCIHVVQCISNFKQRLFNKPHRCIDSKVAYPADNGDAGDEVHQTPGLEGAYLGRIIVDDENGSSHGKGNKDDEGQENLPEPLLFVERLVWIVFRFNVVEIWIVQSPLHGYKISKEDS